MEKEIELFRPQKEIILKYVRSHGAKKISTYSATTFIPLLVIYAFVLEDIPEMKEIAESKIAELKKFYGIKE